MDFTAIIQVVGCIVGSSRAEQAAMVSEFPQRLRHDTPSWVKDGALFHIRLRVASASQASLVGPALAPALLKAAMDYHATGRWWCELFLLMPDHVHALLVFPGDPRMSVAVRNWKRGAARIQDVQWQDNFLDHRIRSKPEAQEKWHYIRLNPVVKGLCARKEDWPHWWGVQEEAC